LRERCPLFFRFQFKDFPGKRTLQAPTPIRTASHFTAEQFGNTVIIRLKPRCLDSRFSERDRREVGDLLARHCQVVLDFAEVATTNSSGLVMIADWVKFVQSTGNPFVLAQCSGPILSLLSILRRYVPVVSSWRDALVCFDVSQNAIGPAQPAKFFQAVNATNSRLIP
jgi:anti-anti-sigma regulatory factor